MKKKSITVVLAALVLCVLIGIAVGSKIVASAQTEKIDLADFINEDGEFAYPGVAWDLSLSELEEVLEYRFQEPIPELSTISGFQATYSMEFVNILGCKAQVLFTFTGDKLNRVDINFFDAMTPSLNRDPLGNDLKRLAPKLQEKLMRLYEADLQTPPPSREVETVWLTKPLGSAGSGQYWQRGSTEEWFVTRMGMYSREDTKGDMVEVGIRLMKLRR